MRTMKTRLSDSTFELNLAPFLDIIVSVVPLLLLSVVFVEIKMIETPVPQVVQNAMDRDQKDPNPQVSLNLKVAKANFVFEITDHGDTKSLTVPGHNGSLDFDALKAKAIELKNRYPQVFKMGLAPESDVEFKELVKAMDAVRKVPNADRKVAFVDTATGQRVETDLMFPNVTFSNVVGE
jgi:biopolymer transport protein ExbD